MIIPLTQPVLQRVWSGVAGPPPGSPPTQQVSSEYLNAFYRFLKMKFDAIISAGKLSRYQVSQAADRCTTTVSF